MDLQKQIQKGVTNLELSKRLRELGVPQDSLFWWVKVSGFAGHRLFWQADIGSIDGKIVEKYSALTPAELGRRLPEHTKSWYILGLKKWVCEKWLGKEGGYAFEKANTEANARAKMLIYLIGNKLIEF